MLSRGHILALAAFAIASTSWPELPVARAAEQEPAQEASHAPRAIEESADARTESFTITAANTGERVVAELVNGAPTDETMRALRHQFRSLDSNREGPLDPRLVILLAAIARESSGDIELVSAYRAPKSARDHNYHAKGMAADIRIKGTTTEALRTIARDVGSRGTGYYPTSKMIHVDVRDVPYQWIDWSGPSRPRHSKH